MSEQVQGASAGVGAAPHRGRETGWRRSLLDLTGAKGCIAFLVLLATPTLIALSLLVGPFQSLDEASHFYRAVQIADGRVLPVRSPQANAAGDYLDANVQRLASYYDYVAFHRRDASFGVSPSDEATAAATPLAHRSTFVAFSNTVIYFPLAHAAPALAIAVMKGLNAPPITWLYAGRLINSALAIAIFCAAIAAFPEGRVFVFVMALLPRTLFGTAALSADALLVPFAALFAAMLARLSARGALTPGQYALLGLAMLWICITKIAYIPLVVIPPAIAFMSGRRLNRAVIVLSAFSVLTVVIWLGWAKTVGPYVYSIRHDVHTDVYGQFHNVVTQPVRAIGVLARTIWTFKLYYLDTMVGGVMGSDEARFPRPFVVATYLVLFVAAFVAAKPRPAEPLQLTLVALVMAGTSVVVFLFLYMQYTAFNAKLVDGIQGRYFLPLLPAIVAFSPKFAPSSKWGRAVPALMVCWMAFCCADTVHIMAHRFWNAAPAQGLRYGDDHVLDY